MNTQRFDELRGSRDHAARQAAEWVLEKNFSMAIKYARMYVAARDAIETMLKEEREKAPNSHSG